MILDPKNNWVEVELSFDKKEEQESLILKLKQMNGGKKFLK